MSEQNELGSLTGRIARGAGWILGARLTMRALGFVNTIIVARLLAPEDFGLVAVALTAMQLLAGFSDIGVSQAVVRFRDASRADLDTLFTLAAIRGAAIAAILAIAAPFAAGFYGDERMFWVFAGIALFPLATGLINPRFYEFERNLDFSREFIFSLANKSVGVAVSIAIAVAYRSYWAIILGLVASGFVQLALSYALRPHLPRLSFQSLDKVLGFSGWLAGVSFMAALNNKLDAFILARVVGAGGTGVYYMGNQLAELPTNELAVPVARAVYPGLASLQGDPDRMRGAYLRGVEALGAVGVPAAIGFSFVAQDLIHFLLSEKWDAAVPVVEVITPVLGLQTIFLATQFYAMALGLTRLVFFRELIFFFLRTPVFIWATIVYGLEGAIWSAAACGLVHVCLNLALYARASGRAFWEPLAAARRHFAAAAAMAAYFALARPFFPDLDTAWLRLIVEIASGAAVHLAALFALWRIEGAPDGVERAALAFAGRALRRARRVGG